MLEIKGASSLLCTQAGTFLWGLRYFVFDLIKGELQNGLVGFCISL